MKKIFLFLVFLSSLVSFSTAQEIEKSTPTKILTQEDMEKWQKEEIEKMRKRVPGMIKTVEKRKKQIKEGKAKDPRKEKYTEEEAEFIYIDVDRCIYGLGVAREPEAVPHLSILLLKDPDPAIRKQSAQALGVIGSTEAVPALRKAMEDENEEVKNQSGLGLYVIKLVNAGYKTIYDLYWHLDEDTIPYLKKLFDDEDEIVKFLAAQRCLTIESIKNSDKQEALVLLKKLSEEAKDPRIREKSKIFIANVK